MNIRTVLSIASLTVLAGASSAQINVAASANGGVASQSSTYSPGFSEASRANDGNRSGAFGDGIAHTNNEFQPFWQDSFATATSITTVNVFNRTDSDSGRINTFDVLLYRGSNLVFSATNQTFVPTITGSNISGMSFNTGGVVADRVRIQLDGQNYLQLGEVEAFSPVPEPASVAALGFGALALIRKRRRRSL